MAPIWDAQKFFLSNNGCGLVLHFNIEEILFSLFSKLFHHWLKNVTHENLVFNSPHQLNSIKVTVFTFLFILDVKMHTELAFSKLGYLHLFLLHFIWSISCMKKKQPQKTVLVDEVCSSALWGRKCIVLSVMESGVITLHVAGYDLKCYYIFCPTRKFGV